MVENYKRYGDLHLYRIGGHGSCIIAFSVVVFKMPPQLEFSLFLSLQTLDSLSFTAQSSITFSSSFLCFFFFFLDDMHKREGNEWFPLGGE